MNEMIPTNKTVTAATGPRPIVWAAIGAVGALSLALAGLGFSKVMNRSAESAVAPAPSAISQAEPARQKPSDASASPPKAELQQAATPSVNHRHTAQAPATSNYSKQPSAPAQVAQAANPNLGTVQSVRAIQQKGEGTGAGAVIGGVLGGVLGHQVGGGTGKDLATVGGAVGGGVLGHQIERNVRGKTVYEVTVRMDNGTLRTFTQGTASAVGSRVFAEGGSLRSA